VAPAGGFSGAILAHRGLLMRVGSYFGLAAFGWGFFVVI
jgi:hypothetical protein